MSKYAALIIGSVCALSQSVNAATNLFVNPSFESGPAFVASPNGDFMQLNPGNSLTGWTITGGGVDWIRTYWQAADGSFSLDLNNLSPGGVEQTVATTPGKIYQIVFALAANPNGDPPAVKTMHVLVNGAATNFQFDKTGHTFASMGWQDQSLQFTAATASTTIDFESTTTGTPAANALDNARLFEVPEPGAIGIVGLAATMTLRRRRA